MISCASSGPCAIGNYLLPIQPEVNLSHAAHFRKLAEDQIDGARSGHQDLSPYDPRLLYVPDGNASNQGPSLRLLHHCGLCALSEPRHFHLAEGALYS